MWPYREAAVIRLRSLAILGAAAGIACGACTAQAQQMSIPQRLAAAKQQIIDLNGDSAAALLQSVLASTSGASGSQRSWAYSLMALTRLAAQDQPAAQQMFRQALNQDPRLPGDSIRALLDLDSQADVVYQQALTWYRNISGGQIVAAPRDTLRVAYTVAPDALLADAQAQLVVTPRPTHRARTVVTVAAVDAPVGSVLTGSDTLPPGSLDTLRVNFRRADGASYVQSGQRYRFTLTALDSLGFQAQAQWVMRAEIQRPIVRQLPPDLPESALRPETTQVKQRSMPALLGGAGLGVAAALLPTAFGQTQLNSGLAGDGTAYVVAGSLTIAGIVGFLNGRRAVFSPNNARFNADRIRLHEDSVQAVRRANELAQQRPPIRLVTDRSPNP
jgi:hypothetical protein